MTTQKKLPCMLVKLCYLWCVWVVSDDHNMFIMLFVKCMSGCLMEITYNVDGLFLLLNSLDQSNITTWMNLYGPLGTLEFDFEALSPLCLVDQVMTVDWSWFLESLTYWKRNQILIYLILIPPFHKVDLISFENMLDEWYWINLHAWSNLGYDKYHRITMDILKSTFTHKCLTTYNSYQ